MRACAVVILIFAAAGLIGPGALRVAEIVCKGRQPHHLLDINDVNILMLCYYDNVAVFTPVGKCAGLPRIIIYVRKPLGVADLAAEWVNRTIDEHQIKRKYVWSAPYAMIGRGRMFIDMTTGIKNSHRWLR